MVMRCYGALFLSAMIISGENHRKNYDRTRSSQITVMLYLCRKRPY